MSSVGLQDVAMMDVSSAYRANSTSCESKGMSLTYKLEDRGEQSTLSYPMPHAKTRRHGRLEGRFEHPTPQVG